MATWFPSLGAAPGDNHFGAAVFPKRAEPFGESVTESFAEAALFVQFEAVNSGKYSDERPASDRPFHPGKRIASGLASVPLEEPDRRESGP
jgi:hypothetical protein